MKGSWNLKAICFAFWCFVLVSPGLFSEQVPEILVHPGAALSIPCSVVTPGGSVQWFQSGEPVALDLSSTERRHWNISRDGKAALAINEIHRDDEGLWECWEVGDIGPMRRLAKAVKLVVTNAPLDPHLEMEGRRLAHQATITIQEKHSLSLHCITEKAVPAVRQVHWFLNSENVTGDSQLFIEFSADDETYVTRSVITLNVTRERHKNEVICRVQHVSWMHPAAVSASLNVLYVPSFSISRQPGFGFPILAGMAVWLKCDVDANPASAPQWQKDGKKPRVKPSADGFLNFTDIRLEDSGWYRCNTEHQFGTYASFGYFLNVRAAEMDITVPPTSYQVLEEPYSSAPAVGGALQADCDIHGLPRVDPVNRTLMAIAGRPITLSVHFCANPMPLKMFWVFRRRVLRPGDSTATRIAHNISDDYMRYCYIAALEILEVEPEDAGDVYFFVKNGRGVGDAVILLNITHASYSVGAGTLPSCSPFGMLALLFMVVLSYLITNPFYVREAR